MEKYRQVPIKGLENYEVSNYGNVRNIKTGNQLSTNPTGGNKYKKYPMASMYSKTKKKAHLIQVHKLVALAFLEKPENDKWVIDHIDNNPLNNHVDNLQWLSQRVNCNKNAKNDLPMGMTFQHNSFKLQRHLGKGRDVFYIASYTDYETAVAVNREVDKYLRAREFFKDLSKEEIKEEVKELRSICYELF